jgi:hypothetical protein
MKGMVFTEFLEMVEDRFGLDMADKIINESDLPSQGVYTAVGTYQPTEMFSLVANLSKNSGIEVSVLLKVYGEYVFSRFAVGYAKFFSNVNNTFDFLSQIENYIHVEVLKLYPDAELPKFEMVTQTNTKLEMIYSSERKLYDFAEGLIIGCLKHFNEFENTSLNKKLINENGSKVMFILEKK